MAMERGDLYLLENFENDLLETLAVDTLLPHLRKNKLLTPNEMDSLTKSGISRREAARELLRILKTKGSGSFSLFIDALRMEKEHMGHQSLYKAITTYCQTEEAETLQAESVISFPQDEKSLQYQLGETLVKPKGAMISTPHPIGTDVVGSLPLCMWSQKSSSSSSITSSSLPHSPLHSSSNNLHGMFMSKLLDIEGHLRSNSRHIVEIKDIMKSTASIHEGINHDAKYVDKRRASIDSGEVSKISEPSMEKSRISNTSLKRPLEKSATCPSLSRMIFQEPSAGCGARNLSSPQPIPNVTHTESIKIPSISPFSPPLIRPGQVIFFSIENRDSTNKSAIHIFELETRMWRNVDVPKIPNSYALTFCLLYEGCIAVLCLETMKSHCANVAIYKLNDNKEVLSTSWKRIPFTNDTLMPIDFSCQCVQSNRNIVLASICQSSDLVVYVHRYSSQQSWIKLSFSVKTTTICSYELQSCAIAHHTLYCSLSYMERTGQQKIVIYKVDLDLAIKNGDAVTLEVVCNWTFGILHCHLLILNSRPIVVNMIKNNVNRCNTLEVYSLNDICTKLFQKDNVFGTKLISASPLPTTCNDDVLIVYYDNDCDEWYLEIFSLSWPKE